MKKAIYAGSFDPWSFGHQFVLQSALQVFDEVHVLAAVNPAKQSDLEPNARACCIAHSINPFEDWWEKHQPFHVNKQVVVASIQGLVADYAREKNIRYLVRGLRSTSDFEAEFNLYFSNRSIDHALQTWCIMCPPELLHCSSTYVRSVVGQKGVASVGTNFLTQSMLLKTPRSVGHVLDLIQTLSEHRFDRQPADLTPRDLNGALQRTFLQLIDKDICKEKAFPDTLNVLLRGFLISKAPEANASLSKGNYPSAHVASLWAMLARAAQTAGHKSPKEFLQKIEIGLGKTDIPLFAIDETLRALDEQP